MKIEATVFKPVKEIYNIDINKEDEDILKAYEKWIRNFDKNSTIDLINKSKNICPDNPNLDVNCNYWEDEVNVIVGNILYEIKQKIYEEPGDVTDITDYDENFLFEE